jgi:hypothetical protein
MSRQKLDLRRQAMRAIAGVLRRAEGSKDDDRILASAKQVLSMLDRPGTSAPEKVEPIFDVNALTDAEFDELGRLLEPLQAFKARVRQRLGIDAPTPTAPQAPIDPVAPIVEPCIDAIVEEPPFVVDADEVEIELEEEA